MILSEKEVADAIDEVKILIGQGESTFTAIIMVSGEIEKSSGIWPGNELYDALELDPEYQALVELCR